VTGKTPNPGITLAFFVIALPGFYYPTPQNWQKAYKLPSSGESFPKKLHFHLAFQLSLINVCQLRLLHAIGFMQKYEFISNQTLKFRKKLPQMI